LKAEVVQTEGGKLAKAFPFFLGRRRILKMGHCQGTGKGEQQEI